VTQRTPASATRTSRPRDDAPEASNPKASNPAVALQACKNELQKTGEFDNEFKVTMCCRRECNGGSCARGCARNWKRKEY
jgi:hypothetical protein